MQLKHTHRNPKPYWVHVLAVSLQINMLLTPVDYQKFAVSTCSRPIQVFVFPLWEGIGKIKFPLLSDFKKEASEAYDVLADDGSSHRGLFLIDKLLGRMDRMFSERSGMCI